MDDFYYSEPSRTALSGFNSFCFLQSQLGFTMKESKAQKPSQVQALLGVVWTIFRNSITAGPSEKQIQPLSEMIRKALLAGSHNSEEPARSWAN